MLQIKLAGPGAAARKYDLISALGAHALSLGKHDQRLVLRLITLLTARYNWARDDLSVGGREIARMWSCNERTVKREMAKLRALGWLVVKRQGARGRVTRYGVDVEVMLRATKGTWEAIGPDFGLRQESVREEKVVPFPTVASVSAPSIYKADEWGLAQAVLYQQDAARYGAWLAALKRTDRAGGRLVLCAPSRFHAAYVTTHLMPVILAACQSVDSDIASVELTV